jgi:hypothetical protein
MRRRKATSKKENPYTPPEYAEDRGGWRELGHGEVHEVENTIPEVAGDTVKYQYELETRPAELDGRTR